VKIRVTCRAAPWRYKGGAVSSVAEEIMARKYSEAASRKVGRAMHERKRGALKSGRSGAKVKSRKQAIAIGLSEARRAGKKVPKKRAARKRRSR
jgi:hypothetical protein